MAEQTAREFLRSIGMEDDEITRATADIDQYKAEADHLISHAVGIVTAKSNPEALLHALGIRDHLTDVPEQARPLLGAVVFRAGQAAASLVTRSRRVEELEGELAEAKEQLQREPVDGWVAPDRENGSER